MGAGQLKTAICANILGWVQFQIQYFANKDDYGCLVTNQKYSISVNFRLLPKSNLSDEFFLGK
jgi:hypothetical protein